MHCEINRIRAYGRTGKEQSLAYTGWMTFLTDLSPHLQIIISPNHASNSELPRTICSFNVAKHNKTLHLWWLPIDLHNGFLKPTWSDSALMLWLYRCNTLKIPKKWTFIRWVFEVAYLLLQQYALKTIENIAHKESSWSQRFASPEVMNKLVGVLKLSKADSCRWALLLISDSVIQLINQGNVQGLEAQELPPEAVAFPATEVCTEKLHSSLN